MTRLRCSSTGESFTGNSMVLRAFDIPSAIAWSGVATFDLLDLTPLTSFVLAAAFQLGNDSPLAGCS